MKTARGNTTVGQRIRMIRETRNRTRKEFARDIGISDVAMGRIERGDSGRLAPELLRKIVDRLYCEVNHLFEPLDAPIPPARYRGTRRFKQLDEAPLPFDAPALPLKDDIMLVPMKAETFKQLRAAHDQIIMSYIEKYQTIVR
jgi:transcriptional regulator with XRE-family HTH domain